MVGSNMRRPHAMPSAPPRTPVRRVSHGSLSALARSSSNTDAPHGLGFLEPALAELADEAEVLQANAEALHDLGDSLHAFNEGFAAFLYAMQMNALTVDWPDAPRDNSFERAAKRAKKNALKEVQRRVQSVIPGPSTPKEPDATANETINADSNKSTTTTATNAMKVVKKKKPGKAKMTAKERKARDMAIDKVLQALPLEFRGQDPNLRRHAESVVDSLLDTDGEGILSSAVTKMVKPPDLNQARVNKCLLALCNRKIVQKDSSSGTVLYYWKGLPE